MAQRAGVHERSASSHTRMKGRMHSCACRIAPRSLDPAVEAGLFATGLVFAAVRRQAPAHHPARHEAHNAPREAWVPEPCQYSLALVQQCGSQLRQRGQRLFRLHAKYPLRRLRSRAALACAHRQRAGTRTRVCECAVSTESQSFRSVSASACLHVHATRRATRSVQKMQHTRDAPFRQQGAAGGTQRPVAPCLRCAASDAPSASAMRIVGACSSPCTARCAPSTCIASAACRVMYHGRCIMRAACCTLQAAGAAPVAAPRDTRRRRPSVRELH